MQATTAARADPADKSGSRVTDFGGEPGIHFKTRRIIIS
jgi:hypothetical protein